MTKKYINNIFVFIIRIYQLVLSPYIKSNCRFYPTCSEYAVLSFKKYNTIKAFSKIIVRIMSCHHFSKKNPVDMP